MLDVIVETEGMIFVEAECFNDGQGQPVEGEARRNGQGAVGVSPHLSRIVG